MGRGSSPGEAPPKSIAVIRLSSVGDVIMAMPAVESLRAAFPAARIAWIVESRTRNVVEAFPAIDEIIEFPRQALRALWSRPFGLSRCIPVVLHFWRELRRRRFDLALDFQGNLKSAACTLMTGARLRVGYAREECREPNWIFTNRKVSLGGQAVHRMDRDLLLVGAVGAAIAWRRPRIAFGDDDRRVGLAVLPLPRTGRPVVVLHPGTSAFMSHKRWPLERYAALGDRLHEEASARVLLSWGPGEEEMAGALQRMMRHPAGILPPTPTIKSLGFVLSRSDLVVGSDTGPVHLAVALGVPALAILGPGDPRHYYPYGHPERVFYRHFPCSPCRNRSCQQRTCLEDVGVGEVAHRALEVLASSRRA